MRTAHLTKNRANQIQRSLKLLEQSFSKGNITRATYVQRKDDLTRLLNQSRTLNRSALAKDPRGFFERNVINHSSAPVGFLERLGLKKPSGDPQIYPDTNGQFWQPGDFLNTFGLKQGQKAHNGETAQAPTITQNMANQMVNQGFNRANNNKIRKSLLEASNRETWNDIDIQSVLNNQETSYQTSVESAGVAGGLGISVTNLPSYDRFSKERIGTYEAEAVVNQFLRAVENLNFAQPNILELIENEARSAAIRLYYAQVPTEDIQPILVNAITGTSSELLNSFEALEAVNNGADVMNQAKTGPDSTLFNSFYNTFGNDTITMNPSMSDPLKAIDLPTLYAMAEEAVGNEANQIQAEIITRQEAMSATRRSSKTSRMNNNATGRGYNSAQAIKNRIATNKAFETSTAALQAQKADFNNVLDDILRIDGKLILDVSTGQFNAFVTEDELKNAIRGINYALAAEYWDQTERTAFENIYAALQTQLDSMASGSMPAMGPSAASMSIQSPSGNFNQSQQATQQATEQTIQQAVQQNLNQSANNNESLDYDWYLNWTSQPMAFPSAPDLSNLANEDLMIYYAERTDEIDSNVDADKDPFIMVEYWAAHEQMQQRGLFNNMVQGAPRKLGLVSGALGLTTQQSAVIQQVSGQLMKASQMHRGQAERLRSLGGATTSTSTSSAHGAMRAHTARMAQQDPREGLYEY